MVRRKFVDPRNGLPSMRQLAHATGVHPTTISEMMYGTRSTKEDLINRVAVALDLPAAEVSSWIGRARSVSTPFEPHPDADLLTQDERAIVNELIRVLAAPKKSRDQGLDLVLKDEGNMIAIEAKTNAAFAETFRNQLVGKLKEDWEPATIEAFAIELLQGGVFTAGDVDAVLQEAQKAADRHVAPIAARKASSAGRALRTRQDEEGTSSQDAG